MKNHDYLLKCIELIEERLQAGPSADWIDYNFATLHDQIFEATKVPISVRTLKRIFKSGDDYEPQIATKNAMAQYLGYRDWIHFVKENFDRKPEDVVLPKTETTEPTGPVIKHKRSKKTFYWMGAAAVIIIASVVFLLLSPGRFSFTVKNTNGQAPLTVAVSYDLSSLNYKNAFIDYGSGGEYKLLLSPKGEMAYLYKTPNYFKMRLMVDGKVLNRTAVDVQTKGWACYVGNNDANAQVVTDQTKFSNGSSLYFAPANISALNIDTKKEFWVDYRNIRNFNIDGDHMTVEFRLRNSQETGGFDCYDTTLEFTGETGRGLFKFVKPGCTQYADTEFGDTQMTGNFHNLSSLGVDLSKWTVVRIQTQNKTSSVYIDNKYKFKTTYNTPIGNIRGLFCRFKGSGQLDFVRVYNAEHKLVYSDEFN
ncbi:hypothetical protein C8P68_101748 [Mucilaginibacter yixingensis]|uniref:Uncharacterized protein n=1 Tax=Mucilaginibacter yixingensis TaxID=1295612 RepID=A0A2T5JGJ8_9SPHI|nr:hypothetical protein [Mucilaginibacter yixingensis]PTR01514.1 hypothetical protein C8P68_101748 [Mucilaginibacter yixingensis]